jgi:acyl-CoA synthetase (AMP-forming)/AMP-acid ligase II
MGEHVVAFDSQNGLHDIILFLNCFIAGCTAVFVDEVDEETEVELIVSTLLGGVSLLFVITGLMWVALF